MSARRGGRRRIRVLHVINSLGVGGAESVLLRLVRHLPEIASIESGICILRTGGALRSDMPRQVPVWCLDYPGNYRRIAPTLRTARILRSVSRNFRADVVHSYVWLSDLMAGLALGPGSARHLCHIVDRRPVQTSMRPQDIVRRNLTRAVLRHSDAHFVAVSQTVMDYACQGFGWPLERVRVAYNGVDLSEFPPAQRPCAGALANGAERQAPLVVGMLSRMIPEKGHVHLFRAASRLHAAGLEVRLRIAGTGPRREELGRLARDCGVIDRTEFLGEVPSAAAFYRSVDAFVQPSVEGEGLPTTILEAMASAVPVICTDVGGAAEAVETGVSGILVPPADDRALAAALKGIAQNRKLRDALASSGRERVESHFTARAMAETVAAAYFDLLHDSLKDVEEPAALRRASESSR